MPKVGTCKTHTRIGKAGDGGKNVCLDNIVAGSCVVYSLGSRLDFSFENDVVDKLNCEVHTFDCTVGSPSKVPHGIHFHPWCIGGSDEKKTISSDLGHGGEIGQYYTLETIMSKLGHFAIDLLKMDIERHEFDVVQNLAVFPTQIVFETHLHNAYGMFRRPVSALEWTSFWKKLDAAAYEVFAYEPNEKCRCCCEWSIQKRPCVKVIVGIFSTITSPAESQFEVG